MADTTSRGGFPPKKHNTCVSVFLDTLNVDTLTRKVRQGDDVNRRRGGDFNDRAAEGINHKATSLSVSNIQC